jgi:FkbM family methyltransferase
MSSIVLATVNDHPHYLACVPFFFKAWTSLGYTPYLVFVGTTLPPELVELQKMYTIVSFTPPPGLHTAFVAQSLRLYYPSLVSDDMTQTVLITDIDMIPLSARFFKDEVGSYDRSKFHTIDYKHTLYNYGYLPMCYNFGTVKLWRELNGITSFADLQHRYIDYSKSASSYSGEHGGAGWFSDQIDLTTMVKRLQSTGMAHYHTNTDPRLERWDILVGSADLVHRLKTDYYRDYHIFSNQVSSMTQMDRTAFVCETRYPIHRYSHVDNQGVFFEEKLDRLFQKRNGFYIELGANNGLEQSNTAFFEKHRDWKGILIEPSYAAYEACKVNRPKSICLQYACVSNDYAHPFVEGDFTSTHLMASVEGARLHSTDLCKVPAITLEAILDTHLGSTTTIDLLSLDTEGYELPILKGLSLDKYRPSYMLIEIYTKDYDEIVSFLKSKRYTLHSNFSNYNKITNPGWDGTHNDYLFVNIDLL